ncbi:hypothetical protein JQ617_24615 [Bradyrhizobium sp. KB893862 SZCCT0404]|uniref:hypothetical protein n=1 Tax=Bradyrhizobium sp. KB893862 SZCCT0404 TaxID=2807672 RepID=UPI001BA5DD47|nr:hypothetical protein [Bradyrhizobium sp. KB893862 SZCCT0404]MBR1177158.1 hypothetical protein [Bradyrhizobium sp. KB893862 SZCCT0404]
MKSNRIFAPPQDYYYLRLLELGPFQRRARGGWRFGTKVINDAVIERLIASGKAILNKDLVCLADPTKK